MSPGTKYLGGRHIEPYLPGVGGREGSSFPFRLARGGTSLRTPGVQSFQSALLGAWLSPLLTVQGLRRDADAFLIVGLPC